MLTARQTLKTLYGLLIRWSCVRVTYNPPIFKQNINNLARYFDCQKYKFAPQKQPCSAKNNLSLVFSSPDRRMQNHVQLWKKSAEAAGIEPAP